ncbi:MAG: hypothetical protein ABI840_09070 [bacterium]
MGRLVITCFKPKEGKDKELLEVIKDHMPVLRGEGLVTDRECYVMKSKNGSILEVFEWKSEKAIEDAHKNENVYKLWKRFEEVCEYKSLSDLEETKGPFPGFEPIDL